MIYDLPRALKMLLLLAATLVCVSLVAVLVDLDLWIVQHRSADAATQKKLDADLDEAHRLILEAGLTAMEARKASTEERRFLGQWNAQITATLNGTNLLIAHLDESQSKVASAAVGTLSAASETVSDVQPVLSEVRTAAATTNATIGDLDRLITSPDLSASMHNVQTVTGNMALISGDFEAKFHDLIYPPKCHGEWCWAKRTFNFVKDVKDLPEIIYWAEQAHLIPIP